MDRREFAIAVGAAVGATALAGCLEATGDGEGTESTEATDETTGTGTAGPTTADDEYAVAGGADTVEFRVLMEGPSEADADRFRPPIVQVATGGTVTWENVSGAHSTTVYHPDNDAPARVPPGTPSWDSGVLTAAAAAFEHTFDSAGVYDYYCTPHEGAGMVGTVVVGEPGPENQPALEAPQDDLPEGAQTELERLNEVVRAALSEGG